MHATTRGKSRGGEAGPRWGPGRWLVWPLGCAALVLAAFVTGATASPRGPAWSAVAASLAVGQQSLLDLGEEEPLTPPAKQPAAGAAEKPAAEEAVPPAAGPAGPAKPPAAADEEEAPLGVPPLAGPAPEGAAPAGPAPAAPGPARPRAKATEPPYDLLFASSGEGRNVSGPRHIKMIPDLLRPPFPRGREYEFQALTPSGKGYLQIRPMGYQISTIIYYEERMLQQAADIFGCSDTELARAGQIFPLSDPKKAQAAAEAAALLQTALAEHDSAIQRYVRRGAAWTELRRPLAQARFNLLVSEIQELVRQQRYPQATAACDRMFAEPDLDLAQRQRVRGVVEQILLDPALQAVQEERYADARELLLEYLRRYPQDPGSKANTLRAQLIAAARQRVAQAVAAKDPKLIDQAAAIWPHLVGLDEARYRIVTEHPVLNCAYATLPRRFSPVTARTPVERHAVGLMFESLVRWSADPDVGPHYAVQLADGRPQPLAKGREFRLPRCVWSDSTDEQLHLCTREDVRWTVEVLRKLRPLAHARAWANFVSYQEPADQDPFLFALRLERDHWQPLSFMDFPILAKPARPIADGEPLLAELDQNPVGTGPYRLAPSTSDDRRVRFVANPFYRETGLPKIREVVFHQLAFPEAKDAFVRGDIQLFYGVPREQVVELRNQGKQVIKLPATSVYFLAPNHRRPPLGDANFRLALAHAIHRTAILDASFRPGDARTDHAELTGPFPKGSWATNPKVPPFVPGQAATFLSLARNSKNLGGGLRPLTLIYPDRDPDVGTACKNMTQQWAQLNLQVNPEPVDPLLFYDRVVQQQNFDLAYWRHDFEDETYWLRPLFDPNDMDKGGANFIGCPRDQELEELFKDLALHKDFRKVRALTHKLHEYLARKAVIIPLWQLDTYVAVSTQLRETRFDPITLFRDVAHWQLLPP